MTLDEIFSPLPYGFSSFDALKDRLVPCRAASRLPAHAKTVITVLFPYYLGEENYAGRNVSRYAVPADYHLIAGRYLQEMARRLREAYPENVFEPFIDNSPIPEVRAAVNAGLGVLGRNSLFIHPVYGSWVFLGEIVPDRYFAPAEKKPSSCGDCGACEKACPGGAIGKNGVDPEKCLSYLSQKKGELSAETGEKMKTLGCAWGCDVCQSVCPHNQNAAKTPIPEFYETAAPHVTPDTPVEGRAFAWRGKKVIERNLKAVEERN